MKPNRKRDLMLLDAPIFKLKAVDLDAIAGHVSSCRAAVASGRSHGRA